MAGSELEFWFLWLLCPKTPRLGKKSSDILLQGIAIGDGLCDPISMTGYGNLLHGVGLINRFHQCYPKKNKKNIQKKKSTN